jgi:hypothetical protein
MTEKDIEDTLNQIRLITIMHPQFNNTYSGIALWSNKASAQVARREEVSRHPQELESLI